MSCGRRSPRASRRRRPTHHPGLGGTSEHGTATCASLTEAVTDGMTGPGGASRPAL
jgi:hypothetical protein